MNAPPSSETQRARADLLGKTIAQRYLVKKRIGKGAMGSVFLAEHIVLRVPYALKILHPELAAHEETVQRFIREAQTTASINHPNVCASTDFGKLPDGSFYLVMEYLEGQTLRRLNKNTPAIPPDQAIHIVTQMLGALGKAHALGIVHRDLKPENIMLIQRDEDNHFVKIMDFGLASLVPQENDEERARLTMTGIVYGTPVYMSPEQVRASIHIDGRADLYAIGAMFFEMLTGSIPFQGPNITALLAQHLTEPVTSIRERAPHLDLPAALDPIIARAMAKDASDRFDNAQQFIDALEALSSTPLTDTQDFPHKPTDEKSFETLPTRAKPLVDEGVSPKKKLIALLVGVCLVIAAVGTILTLSPEKPTPEPLPDDPELHVEAVMSRATRSLADTRRAHLDDSPVLKAAAARHANAQPEEARDMLLSISKEHANDPHYHYLLGQTLFDHRQREEALTAYAQAIALEPDYFYDETLLSHLLLALSDHDDALAQQAQRLITNDRLTMLTPWLGERAQHMSGKNRRTAIKNYLIATQTIDALPAWRIAAIDLRTAVGCRAHGDAIKALADANDPKAIKPLLSLSNKPKSGCGKRKNKDCYGCVRQELGTALSVLQAKFPEGDPDTSTPSGDDPGEEEIDEPQE